MNYLNIQITSSSTGKTKIYTLYNKNDTNCETLLGTVKWFGRWRKYCFFTEPGIVFDSHCLEEVLRLLNQVNKK